MSSSEACNWNEDEREMVVEEFGDVQKSWPWTISLAKISGDVARRIEATSGVKKETSNTIEVSATYLQTVNFTKRWTILVKPERFERTAWNRVTTRQSKQRDTNLVRGAQNHHAGDSRLHREEDSRLHGVCLALLEK